tara:strand:+ start:1276 stop:1440 length:165 start_codon:yes stop_codon:yes gene_type:complete
VDPEDITLSMERAARKEQREKRRNRQRISDEEFRLISPAHLCINHWLVAAAAAI